MSTKFVGALSVLAFLGSCADGLTQELLPWQQEILDAHNAARNHHCSPPLSWDPEIAAGAQKWADGCSFTHEPQGGPGENIYWGSGEGAKTAQAAVDGWYSEISKYDFSNPGPEQWSKAGHFIQVVWADEKQLGCGMASCRDQGGQMVAYYVCRYSPRSPMNTGSKEDYEQNVQGRVSSC